MLALRTYSTFLGLLVILFSSCLFSRQMDVPVASVCSCVPPQFENLSDTTIEYSFQDRRESFMYCLMAEQNHGKFQYDIKSLPKEERESKVKEYYNRIKANCPEAMELFGVKTE